MFTLTMQHFKYLKKNKNGNNLLTRIIKKSYKNYKKKREKLTKMNTTLKSPTVVYN